MVFPRHFPTPAGADDEVSCLLHVINTEQRVVKLTVWAPGAPQLQPRENILMAPNVAVRVNVTSELELREKGKFSYVVEVVSDGLVVVQVG